MKPRPGTTPRLALALLVLAPPLAGGLALAGLPGEERREFLERPGQSQVGGRLALAESGLRFSVRSGAADQSLALEPGSVVRFRGPRRAAAIPPLYQVLVGEIARLSGTIRGVTDKAVTLSVPWQAAEVQIARSGVQAVIQRPGEARLFADRFDRIEPTRWTIEGKPEVVEASARDLPDPKRGVGPPAAEPRCSIVSRSRWPPVGSSSGLAIPGKLPRGSSGRWT